MSKYKVCGYDMEELHARMLIIATEVDRICREHGWLVPFMAVLLLGLFAIMVSFLGIMI